MKINSGRPIRALTAREQDGLLEMLSTPVQSEASWRNPSTDVIIPVIGGPGPGTPGWDSRVFVKDLIRNTSLLQRDPNFVPPKVDTPKDQEASALIFTFGDKVGKILIDMIVLQIGGHEIDDETRVFLDANYDRDNIDSMATFIYKATQIWQKQVGRYDRDEAGEDYNFRNLYRLDLTSEQHAAAVKHWFYVNYGIETGVVSLKIDQIVFEELWKKTLEVLELTRWQRAKFGEYWLGGEEGSLQQIVNNHYACVIKEIQDPKPFLQLTNLGRVKAGLPPN